ncbi:MAG: tetratricopeptide repeat protein [Alphaproteobacteria bacterium]|nr:tetratricopeptide repeat protein [Alphaproteobacteria bacterium]
MQAFKLFAVTRNLAIGLALATGPATNLATAKDLGPTSLGCDNFPKNSARWIDCAARAPAKSGPAEVDAQLFYAGYWLARNGRYQEALSYLRQTKVKNARVLTYIGFATRKLGSIEEAMGYYAQALAKDPGNYVARSYLGEAHLARGDLPAATEQLQRVEQGCGRDCDAYRELAGSIARFRTSSRNNG